MRKGLRGGGAMSGLLYITSVHFRHAHVLKFGITKFGDHHKRIACHERSLDNPFASRLGTFTDVAVIRTGGSLNLETFFRRAARAAFPCASPWKIDREIYCISPSGEWIARRPSCTPASCSRSLLQCSVDLILSDLHRNLSLTFQPLLQQVIAVREASDAMVDLSPEACR